MAAITKVIALRTLAKGVDLGSLFWQMREFGEALS